MAVRKTPSRKKSPIAAEVTVEPASPPGFSVVGIGASACGLEAFEHFFRSVPPASGMAYVLVPHLDPGHISILPEILQRTTAMPVLEAQDAMSVMPDHVYVIPPNRDMVIARRVLTLTIPEVPRGQRMPIDAFLRSLAEDQGENAVGIVLSGTGTDGTLGLRAILGAGGVTLVQTPATAKYDGMPASAIQAGYATRVLAVEEMPAMLLSGAKNLRAAQAVLPPETTPAAGGMKQLLMLVRSATGHDFSLYKKKTIARRIERRMAQHDLTDIDVYARYVKEHPAEAHVLFKELLINVTSFFRDPEAFVTLKEQVLPQLLAGKDEGYVFRVWVAGGATGEEAYSIAMLLRELMDDMQHDFKVQLYSTDLSDQAIAVARAGLYPPNIVADVSPERLRRFFVKEDAGYRVKKDIREMVVFAVQDVVKDPPFTRLDLLSCRNLMIYLEPELQARLIPAFHYALKPGGVLLLSPSESIGNHVELFSPLDRKWKCYRAVGPAGPTRAVLASSRAWSIHGIAKTTEVKVKKNRETDFSDLAKRVLMQSYSPASVITDVKGNILYVHGETGKYLRPAPGQATLNVVDMARDGLQLELRAAMLAAVSKGEATFAREICVKHDDGNQAVHLSVRPMHDRESDQDVLMVIFQDVTCVQPAKPRGKRAGPAVTTQRVEELERELAYTRENLQATLEEEQASNEELKSTNEELQSTNEELQSANEEMETSREELQSVNEELITVNAELQAKIEQLAGMQNDMKNLLDNFSVGTIFLDEHLFIRRFTREAAQVFRLVVSDVGRPLADIKSEIVDEDLLSEAQTVLDTLVSCEREVRMIRGAWYLARIQPYRTLDNVIAGVVMSFTNISQRIDAEASVRRARIFAENIVNTIHEPLLVLDSGMTVISANRAFYSRFKTVQQDTVGRNVFALGNGQWDIPALRELLETILPRDQAFDGFVVEQDFPLVGRRKLLLNARRIVGEAQEMPLILLAMQEGFQDKEHVALAIAVREAHAGRRLRSNAAILP